jgi:cellobiose-specific phosphotransferase system component IIC
MYSINSYTKRNRGFIALISVIIIGFVLLLAVITLGGKSIASRFNLLTLEYKNSSYQLASACVQTAIIGVVNNLSYSLPRSIDVGGQTCTIVSVVSGTIKTTATVSGATTNLEVTVNSTTGDVVSWRECKNSTGSCS